jgi:hypothetical protein
VIICFFDSLFIRFIREAKVVVFQLQTDQVIKTSQFFLLANFLTISGIHKPSNSGIFVLIGLKTTQNQSF